MPTKAFPTEKSMNNKWVVIRCRCLDDANAFAVVKYKQLVGIVEKLSKIFHLCHFKHSSLNIMQFWNDEPIFIKISELEIQELGIDEQEDIQIVDWDSIDRIRQLNVKYSVLNISEDGFRWIARRKYAESVKTAEIYYKQLDDLRRD